MKEEDITEILDAEIVEEIEGPNFEFSSGKPGQPKQKKGTRKKDYPRFTKENRERILQFLEMGCKVVHASQLAGIHPNTVKSWLARGEDLVLNPRTEYTPLEQDFLEFYIACGEASAKAIGAMVATISQNARRNPNLALKWLEKLAPEEYGPRQAIEMTGKIGHLHGHISLDRELKGGEVAKKLTEEQLWRLRTDMDRKELTAGEVDHEEDD